MNIKTLMASALTTVLLAGCAGGAKPHTVKATNGSSIDVFTAYAMKELNNNRYADTSLREVTPVHAGTGMGLAVVGAVLGGGVSSGAFDKNNYKGNLIESMKEPTATYFGPKAESKIQAWLDKQGGSYAYTQPLYIGAATWSLVYTDMSASNSNYDLTYRVLFYKRPEGGNMFSTYVISECAPTVKTAPLSDWQANNYQKVTQETQKMMDACLLELDNQLPRLLKK